MGGIRGFPCAFPASDSPAGGETVRPGKDQSEGGRKQKTKSPKRGMHALPPVIVTRSCVLIHFPAEMLFRRPCLVVDALNQMLPHWNSKATVASWIKGVRNKIKMVSRVARERQLLPVFVVDAAWKGEVEDKWFQRREREVRTGKRGMVLNADIILSEILCETGRHLIADKRNNGDDVVASYALLSNDKSIILSADRDYFRYGNGELEGRVYCFNDTKRDIRAVQRNSFSSSRLPFITNFAPSFLEDAAEPLAGKLYAERSIRGTVYPAAFIRGTTYPEAELNGKANLHLAARLFRQELYLQRVYEMFPYWNGAGVSWVDEIVEPLTNTQEVSVRRDPVAIANDLLQRTGGWYNERHAETIFVYACELAAHYHRSSILAQFRPHLSSWRKEMNRLRFASKSKTEET